jgi:hypothetical protein
MFFEVVSAVPAEFVALITKVKLPVAVAVPLITPVVAFNERPVGSAPDKTLKVGAGKPLAVIVLEKVELRRAVEVTVCPVMAGSWRTVMVTWADSRVPAVLVAEILKL